MDSSNQTIISDARRRLLILISVCAALTAVIASASGLNVAQQQVAESLDASQPTVLWIINSYIVVLAALLLPAGALADRLGRKKVLFAGLLVFGVASAGAAFAQTSSFLILTRLVAGVGAAMIMPVTLSVITSSFPPENRPQAIGIWTGVAGGGGLIGMIAAAFLTDLADWRWLFSLPVLLVAASYLIGRSSIPRTRELLSGKFDLIGSLFAVTAVGGTVLAIDQGVVHGWERIGTIVLLALGVAASIAFVLWELRFPSPLIDLRDLRDRRLRSGSLTLLVVFAVLGGVFLVLFPYFQAVLGWSAIHSILGFLPMVVVMMGASGLAPKIAAKVGGRNTMLAGIALATFGLALMASLVSVDGRYLAVLPGMLTIGLGMGITMTPSTEAITSSLPDESQGVASAINDTTREVGSALGVALLGGVLASKYSESIRPLLAEFPARTTDAASEGIARASLVAAETGGVPGDRLLEAARQAFVEGWAASMWIGAIAMGVLFLVVLKTGSSAATMPARQD